MKKSIVIAVCLLLLPMAALAANKAPYNFIPPNKAPAAGPSAAAINACIGKAAGDAVDLYEGKGEMVQATCQDMKGQLVAVPNAKKKTK